MEANYIQRVRLKFSKNGPTRFISHLDLIRTFERAFNRAKIPLSYTQGYNPLPRMQFADALPLGFSSEWEWVDIWLLERVNPLELILTMSGKVGKGLIFLAAEEVPLSAPALQNIVSSASYKVSLGGEKNLVDLQKRIEEFLSADSIIRERKGKEYDLRPRVLDLLLEGENGEVVLKMIISLGPGRTGRPDEVLAALGLDPLSFHIHRTGLLLNEETTIKS